VPLLPQELAPIDALLTRWGRWARGQLTQIGWPRVSLTGRMIDWHELGLEPEHLYPAGATRTAPAGVMVIDKCVAQLKKKYRRVIYTEYFIYGSIENKAKALRTDPRNYKLMLSAAVSGVAARVDMLERRASVGGRLDFLSE
jgi:hypothetical protein